MFVVIDGLIGVGKSSLATSLAEYLNYDVHLEPTDQNPFLQDYYKNPARWSFAMQMYLLSTRFASQQRAIWNTENGCIHDQSIFADMVFAEVQKEQGLMTDCEYSTYLSHVAILQNFIKKPDLILFLRAPLPVVMERIRKRNRATEDLIPLDYMKCLERHYDGYIEKMKKEGHNIIEMNWSEFMPANVVASRLFLADI